MLFHLAILWFGVGRYHNGGVYPPMNRGMQLMVIAAFALILLTGIVSSCVTVALLTKPIRKLIATLRDSSPHLVVSLGRVNIAEIDELAAAIEDLSLRVSESSSVLSRIIEMSDINIAAFELDKQTEMVVYTAQFFPILGMDGGGFSRRAVPLQDFKDAVTSANLVLDDETEKGWTVHYFTPDGATRWVKLTLMDDPSSMLGVIVDVTEDTLSKRQIEYERDYDLLTNLLNRRAFMVTMRRLFEHPQELKIAALLLLDLDNLKFINDSYGHDCGDGYLRAAADAMNSLPLMNTLVARMSGDEFFIFTHGHSSREQAWQYLDELKQTINESYFILPGGDSIRIRCSAGIAWYPDDSMILDELTRYADFAMYTAKNSAKGSFCEFSSDDYEKDSYLLHSREELNNLIEHRMLDYHFQPIVNALSGEIFAYEALMRSRLSTLSSPMEVLALARAQSKLYEIERLTWFAAMETATHDPVFLESNCRIFINSVSNRMLNDDDIENLRSSFQKYLHRMVLEVTEEEKFNEEITRKKQMLLYRWGGAVALDDFGTGYNGEMVLLQLVPDFVKIDMSIVRNIDTDPSRQELLRNLISYSHERSIMVICEGVETSAEMQTLIHMGVDYLQGYYLGHPEAQMRMLPTEVVTEIQDTAHAAGRSFAAPSSRQLI